MSSNIDEMVTTTVVQWILRLLEGDTPPRINLRFVFGGANLADNVKSALESRNADACHHFVVRKSSDPDAVRLRHGVPPEAPPGATVVYVLFWQPGTAEHERNAQSLTDVHAVEVADILGRASSFILDNEKAIFERCGQAVEAWKEHHRERAHQHLRAAWDGVRTCLREGRGGRQRSIAFAPRLEAYCRFLSAARITDDEWANIPANDRAAALVRRWGESLAELGLFSVPALASVLGVRTRPDAVERIPSPQKTRESHWASLLTEILAENVEYAIDFSALSEALAGKKTLAEQLDALTPRVRLCQTEDARAAARAALERFCHEGNESALHEVEWLFLQDPDDRRSASHGLKGLLLARGRRTPGPDPLDRAASETSAAFDALLGPGTPEAETLRAHVGAQREIVAKDSAKASVMVDALRLLAEGATPEAGSAETVTAFERAASAPARKAEPLIRLSNLWNSLIAKRPDKPVEATNLLLGLARLSAMRASEAPAVDGKHRVADSTPDDKLCLTLLATGSDKCRIELAAGDWSADTRERLATWLRRDVRAAVFADDEDVLEGDESDDPDAREELAIEVIRRSAGTERPLGVLSLQWSPRARALFREMRSDVPTSWQVRIDPGESVPSGARLLRLLVDRQHQTAKPESPDDERLNAAWQKDVRAGGTERGWEVVSMLAPTTLASRAVVDAWADALEASVQRAEGANIAKRREELQAAMSQAVEEGRFPDAQSLSAQLKALPQASGAGTGQELLKDARCLLRLGTVSILQNNRTKLLALTPHHPLVVRLRALQDRVLSEVLERIWKDGWPAVALDDLVDALDSWGAPEPMHAYGFWDGEPLAFDGWTEASTAIFTQLGAGRVLDAASLGAREVGRVVGRYATLFPASADRLRLRICGDNEGRWATLILRDQIRAEEFRADVDLVTSLGAREPTAIEQAIYSGREASEPFELGPEGTLPRVRIRRCSPAALAHAGAADGVAQEHLALLVGDQIREFQPSWQSGEPSKTEVNVGRWDSAILFAEPSPTLSGYAFTVQDPDDELARSVARVVGIAAGANGTVFRERYTFDPGMCEEPLREQQGHAHWLILASRQPLYRAVQQAGSKISTLLDFYTLVERGRPVSVCVSLNSRHASEDLRRIDGALAELLQGSASDFRGEALVAAALRLAPGLAMRCAGATGAAQLGGLLGLLLTGRALGIDHPDAVVLSLDQHASLLAGHGRLGDLLTVRYQGGQVRIGVAESKFSTSSNEALHARADDAKKQISSSLERLRHLAESHPMSLRVRNQLVRALAHQVHMGPTDDGYVQRAEALIRAVRTPSLPIVIEPHDQASVHVWSVGEGSSDETSGGTDSTIVKFHGRKTTLERLASLGAPCAVL